MPEQTGSWVAIYCPKQRTFLFGKRSKLSKNPFHWNFFGGRTDRNESPRRAAVRELAEEAGIKVKKSDLIELATTRVRGSAFADMEKELHFFLLLLEEPLLPRLNNEHSDFAWFHQDNLPLSVTRATLIAYDLGVIQLAIKYCRKHRDRKLPL
jgi:8-oxo-dGTP pyrophosphatase MutT (NUDIX family)